jgi:ABC-2 type transport system permease protein
MTAPSTLLPPPLGAEVPARATYGDAVRSEWTKLRTVRATFWCLFIGAVLGVGLAALVSFLTARRYHSDPEVHLGWNPVTHSIRPLLIAQLVFAVFGVITVTSEYSTGMIRTSLAAVPKRIRMMSAKLLVFSALAFIAAEAIAFAAFSLAQMLIHGQAPSASLHQHLVLRVVIGAGLYLALLGLLGAAVGVLFRQAAAGIAVMVALMLVLPGILAALPSSWSQPIEKFWPTEAGQQVYELSRGSHALSAWVGFGWMALFTAIVIAAAFAVLQRRDA